MPRPVSFVRALPVVALAITLVMPPTPAVARTDSPSAAALAAGYQSFSPRAAYRLCFTPDGDSCEKLIIETIHAKAPNPGQ